MLILGVETSCDDTAAAVLRDDRTVLANVVSSQDQVHGPYGGVVPELASRQHIQNILPIVDGALQKAGITVQDLDGMAVTYGPGLVGSLLVGLSIVKGISYRWHIPYVGINHLEAHLLAIQLEQEVTFPYIALLASGGHTLLYWVKDIGEYVHLGGTRDDAAGEAYDKVAKMMGLGYPGGRIIDNLAKSGDPTSIQFPRTLLSKDSLDFSFSGLKTAVLYRVKGIPQKRPPNSVGWVPPPKPLTQTQLANISASFQSACIDVLTTKLKRASKKIKPQSILIGGGVSANRGLRSALSNFAIPVFFPPLEYCTDNAAMSAALAHLFYEKKNFSPLSLDAIPHSQFSRS